ncbi:hypothetical protein PENTCL1PPCAC_6055, partial [Pristionchus entomophagus]
SRREVLYHRGRRGYGKLSQHVQSHIFVDGIFGIFLSCIVALVALHDTRDYVHDTQDEAATTNYCEDERDFEMILISSVLVTTIPLLLLLL